MKHALIISQWYRDALGGFENSYRRQRVAERARDEEEEVKAATTAVKIKVRKLLIPGWRSVRAACHHPDNAVRIGTRVGVLGAWLAVLGIAWLIIEKRDAPEWRYIPGIRDFIEILSKDAWTLIYFVVALVLTGIIAWLACRRPKRPKRRPEAPRVRRSVQYGELAHKIQGDADPSAPVNETFLVAALDHYFRRYQPHPKLKV